MKPPPPPPFEIDPADPFLPPRDGPVATNPFDPLLRPEKLRELAQMPQDEKHKFYGRVVDSVFSSPAYKTLVFETADREFDRLSSRSDANVKRIVEEVVNEVLKR